jgi:hypothetical protein
MTLWHDMQDLITVKEVAMAWCAWSETVRVGAMAWCAWFDNREGRCHGIVCMVRQR